MWDMVGILLPFGSVSEGFLQDSVTFLSLSAGIRPFPAGGWNQRHGRPDSENRGAWIITGGMNTGIMKLVGEIVQINPNRSQQIPLIGIATWGCISGRKQLVSAGRTVQYTKPRDKSTEETAIEPNHTKFIFIDDGSEGKYGGEIEFRAQLEQVILNGSGQRKNTTFDQYPCVNTVSTLDSEQPDRVPAVALLVVGGGRNTIRTVHHALVQNKIPAVCFEGTGRCCDLFVKAYRLYTEARSKFELNATNSSSDAAVVSRRWDELRRKLREELKHELLKISGVGDIRPANNKGKAEPAVDTTDYFELVYECIHTRTNFLHIVSLGSRNSPEPEIDLAILHALLKASSADDPNRKSADRKLKQLELALQWNRVDIVENYIMKDARDWETIGLNSMFISALRQNKIEFIQLFLDHDFSLTTAFDEESLVKLYSRRMETDAKNKEALPKTLHEIYEHIIRPFIGHAFEVAVALPLQESADQSQSHPDAKCLCCISCKKSKGDLESGAHGPTNRPVSTEKSHLDLDKELFIWSVLTGRRDFNLLFWARGKNKICAALFAVLVYRKLARKDNDSSYHKCADEFEELAVQILDRFYQNNARLCTVAIIRKIPAYGNLSWLELAVRAEAKEFVAQRAIQDVLNNIWYGYIDHYESDRSILFSTIMVWYSGFLSYNNELVETARETTFSDKHVTTVEKPTFFDEVLKKTKLRHRKRTINGKNSKEQFADGNLDVQQKLLGKGTSVNPISDEPTSDSRHQKKKGPICQYFTNVLRFFRAPYVKFLYNLYCHVIFLLLFSYMLVCDFYPLYDYQSDVCPPIINSALANNNNKPKMDNVTEQKISYELRKHAQPAIEEYILAIWIFTLVCEEIRQLFSSETRAFRNKISKYFEEFWNLLDIMAIIVFYIGVALRFAPAKESFCAARIVLSVDLVLWYLRLLNIFTAVKQLGPKLVMISAMTYDLAIYVSMLTVFVAAYGVVAHSLIYGSKNFNWHIPREILNLAYWPMFGELSILGSFTDNYTANTYVVFLLLMIYMAIVAIILLNLLIAMFSNTFDRLQTDTDRIWKFQRYSLICEYLGRPALPPPFIFITHIWRFLLHTVARFIKAKWVQDIFRNHLDRIKYKINAEQSEGSIEIAEDAIGDEVYSNHLKFGRILTDRNELDEERDQSPQEIMFNRIRTVEDRMQILNNQQTHVLEYLDSIMDGLKILGGDQITMPDRHHFSSDISYAEAGNTPDQARRFHRQESLLRESIQSDDIQSVQNSSFSALPKVIE